MKEKEKIVNMRDIRNMSVDDLVNILARLLRVLTGEPDGSLEMLIQHYLNTSNQIKSELIFRNFLRKIKLGIDEKEDYIELSILILKELKEKTQ